MKKITFKIVGLFIFLMTIGFFVFADMPDNKKQNIRINYISEEAATTVTFEEELVDLEIGNGRVWLTNYEEVKSRNSSFIEPNNKVFIGWKYLNSVIDGTIVTSTSAYTKGNHFTQDEYYSLSENETEINLTAVYGYTVYVDGISGCDDGNGSLNSPVRTMGRAYERLAQLDSENPNANITGYTVFGDSSTGYSYNEPDTENLITNFNGRIIVMNNLCYKDQYEGRYLYITYGDLINSENYNPSTGVATFNDGVSIKTFKNLKAATGYAETDPVKLSGSGNTYTVMAKAASGKYHYLLKKELNNYFYELNGVTYYTYGRLTQYTENLRAHVGKGLMTPENTGIILITSNDGKIDYDATFEFGDYTRYASGGDLIYKDLQLAFYHDSSKDKESQTYVCGYAANGHYLAIDENVTVLKDTTHIYTSVYGGGHAYRNQSSNYSGGTGNKLGNSEKSELSNTRLTVKSGTWYGAYGGSYGLKIGRAVTTYGKTENNAAVINIYGGTYNGGIGMGHEGASAINSYVYVYGGQAATVHGSGLGSSGAMTGNGITNVLITGESTIINGTVYGGSTNGSHTGDINLVIKNGTIKSTVYGGNSSTNVTGNIEITIVDGSMKSIIGGCGTGSISGTISLNILGGKIVGDIYASGQGGTQEKTEQYYVGGTQDSSLNSQILDINDDRLNVLITGDSTKDSPAIINAAKKINPTATQYYTDKTLIVDGAEYYYPQLYSTDYTKFLNGYTRGTYSQHGVKQYTIYGRTAFLSLATVQEVNLNIAGGEITGNIFGGGKVAVVEGDVNINISNAKITGNIFGGGDGSYEPTVNLYIPTGRNTTQTQVFTWKGSETFNIEEYDVVKNLPIDFENKYIYSPTYDYMGGVNGNVTINITDSTTVNGNVYGGGNKGLVTGEVYLNIEDTSISQSVYGGGNVGHVLENIQIITKNMITNNLFGGGYSGRIEGATSLTLTSSNIKEVFGGGYSGNINGNTLITINSGNYTNVFGGCDKAVVFGNTHINIGNEEQLAIIISGVLYGGGRGVDADNDGDASDFCTVEGKSEVIITGLNTRVENYGSVKLGVVLGNVDVTFKDYWTGNTTNKYKVMNGIDRATNVYFDNAFVLLENKDENGNLVGIKDITNLYIPEGSGIKISAEGEILGDFHGGGTFYLDSEVCLNIRGNIYGESLIILNPVIMEEGHMIKGCVEYPYMRIYGEDASNGKAIYSDDVKYTIINGVEASGASIYYIENDVIINESISVDIINAEGKHYTDSSDSWSDEDFYLLNSGTFSTDCKIAIEFLDDGNLENLYKNVTRNIVMYTGDDVVNIPVGTNLVMIINNEIYNYRVENDMNSISVELFTKMDDNSIRYNEVNDVQSNSTMVDGNELKKSYLFQENFRFIIDFSEVKEADLLKVGPYNLMLHYYDNNEVTDLFGEAINTIRIEEARKYDLDYNFDREWYESNSMIEVALKMTSDYYILFDEADTTKELVAVITLKNENNKYMVLSENMKFYVDDVPINHTNGNASYIVVDGLVQERMERENVLKIDFSDMTSMEKIKAGQITVGIDFYKAKDGILEEKVEEYDLNVEIIQFKYYSSDCVVKPENGMNDKELLNVNRQMDNSRTLQLNYQGDLIEPYIEILLQEKSTGVFKDITNSITASRLEIKGSTQEIEAIFGSALIPGEYKLIFNLHDKYGGIKTSESILFYCQ